jgi:hypothetical protein
MGIAKIVGEIGQRINGRAYDYSSIEFSAMGGLIVNIKSIKYKHALDPGKFRGTGSKFRMRSRGTYEADGSFEIYKEDYVLLKGKLALLGMGGYMCAAFPIVVTYREFGATVPSKDVLRGCRIVSEDQSYSEGNDPLFVSVDLDIMEIITDGFSAVDLTKKPNLTLVG